MIDDCHFKVDAKFDWHIVLLKVVQVIMWTMIVTISCVDNYERNNKF